MKVLKPHTEVNEVTPQTYNPNCSAEKGRGDIISPTKKTRGGGGGKNLDPNN